MTDASSEPRSIKFNFVMNLIVTGTSLLFPLITYPFVTRMLLEEAYGSVMFAQAVVSYFTMFATLGIATYGIRLVARKRDDRAALSRAVSEVMTILLGAMLVVYVVLAVCVLTIPRLHMELLLLAIFSVSTLLNVVGINWFFAGLERYSFIALMTFISYLVSLVAIFLFIRTPSDNWVYACILVGSAGIPQVVYFAYAFRFADIRIPVRPNLKEHLKPLLTFFFISAAISIYTNLDTVMLGVMVDDVAVGYYNVAVKVKTVLVAATVSLGSVVLPRASYLLEQGRDEEFKALTIKVAHFVQLFALPLCCFFFVFAKACVLILAGPSFLGSVAPLQAIMPAILFIGLTNVLGYEVLTPLGREKELAISTLVAAVVDFLLNLVTIRLWGATGAALSTSVAEVCVFVVQVFLLREFLRGAHLFQDLWKVLVSCVVAFLIPAAVMFLTDWGTIVVFLVSIPAYFGSYVLLVWVLRHPLARELMTDLRALPRRLKERAGGTEEPQGTIEAPCTSEADGEKGAGAVVETSTCRQSRARALFGRVLSEKTMQTVFLAGFCLDLFYNAALTTTVGGAAWYQPTPLICVRVLAFLLLAVKVVLWDVPWLWRTLVRGRDKAGGACTVSSRVLAACYILFGLLCAAVYLSGGYETMLDLCLVVLGARGADFRKAVWVYLVVDGVVVVLAILLSQTGVIPDPAFYRDVEGGESIRRYSLGINYPTDFAAHVFFWFAALLYVLADRARLVACAVLLVAAVVVYIPTNARLDSGCMMLLSLLVGYVTLRRLHARKKVGIDPAGALAALYRPAKVARVVAIWLVPVLAVLFVVMSLLYAQGIPLFVRLDDVLSARLMFSAQGLLDYGVPLLAQPVAMQGGGYDPNAVALDHYFFLDCSYINTLVRFGALFTCLAGGLWVWMSARVDERDDYVLLAILVLVALNCMVAHHWLEVAYDPFLLLLFVQAIPLPKERS